MNNTGNNEQGKKETIAKIESINSVEGFDPMSLALKFGNMNDDSERKHLPVKIQMAWLRLRYPESKIAVEVKPERDYFIAKARIYTHFSNPDNHYLAEGSASRGYTKENPTVSPREWAQTAAIGMALRNAGFGLQADIAGESYEENTLNEFDFLNDHKPPVAETSESIPETITTEASEQISFSDNTQPEIQAGESPQEQPQPELTPIEKAMKAMCPIGKYTGKTLGEMIRIDPNTLPYIAGHGGKYGQEIADYAKLICDDSLMKTA